MAVADGDQNASPVPAPLVAVVVATHDRPQRLERLLDSLRRQTLGTERFEVIVVDDGSAAATPELLARWRSGRGLRLRAIRFERPRGPAAARNAGWRAARAPLVAFTDDDCVADPGWLAAGWRASRSSPGAIVQGRTIPDPRDGDGGLWSRTVRVQTLGPRFETCNIFYPRELLERLGGFDERFGERPAAEDTDLAWRAIERGARAEFAPGAVVLHAVERASKVELLRTATRWQAAVRLFAEHPQTRTILYRGLFWNVWHYLMWRSVAVLLAPTWLRRMVLTLHLLELRRRARRAGGGLRSIPFLLVHDAVECWAVARGGLRYRTPVL
jgi:glycosyltransferase involved in cell wall biosynthesis